MGLKSNIYSRLVDIHPEVKSHYEGFIISNPDFYSKHKGKTYLFLRKLRKYYLKGSQGSFPAAPMGLTYKTKAELSTNSKIRPAYNGGYGADDYSLIKNSLYFDGKWYLDTYPDVKSAGMDPVKHYLEIGWKEYRRPGPSFSTMLYLNRYSDVGERMINPLLHYERSGKSEKRISSYSGLYKLIKKEIELIENSNYFDAKWYIKKYPECKITMETPAVHYYCIGGKLGLQPGPLFNNELFIQSYREVEKLNVPFLLYYEETAKRGGNGYITKSTSYYSNEKLHMGIIKQLFDVMYDMTENQKENTGKRVLLVSHIMNLTGAPRVCLNMATALKKMDFYPVLMSFKRGPLEKEAEREGIPVVITTCYETPLRANEIVKFANMFDYIVFNTIESLRLAHIFQHTKGYKIGWFHEGNETLDIIPMKQKQRINILDEIYMGSPYCKKFFMPLVADETKIKTLFYGVDGSYINAVSIASKNLREDNQKIIFEVVGTIGYRKGTDYLIEAIGLLPEETKEKCEFWMIGSVVDPEVGNQLENIMEEEKCVRHWDSLPYNDLIELESNCDVLLCPSIDDPLPVVVTEAFILKKAVAMSDRVGTSEIVTNGKDAIVFSSNSSEAIKEVIEDIVGQKYDLKAIGETGYHIYENYLSIDRFEKNIKKIFVKHESVNCDLRVIDNVVTLYDIIVKSDSVQLVFSCDKSNKLYLYSEDGEWLEKEYSQQHWRCLNDYFSSENKRLAIIEAKTMTLIDFSLAVGSLNFDTINLDIGVYSWIKFNQLAKKGICIKVKDNIIRFLKTNEFIKEILTSREIDQNEKKFIKKLQSIKEYKYNVYVETRDNMNDNAFSLFLYDLKTNDNAYFITTQSVYENVKDEYIKKHLLILNTNIAKNYMVHAKNIIVSWHATPIFGQARMKYLYPFLRMNYIFVPHGISYDKDSYYLNKSHWGYFNKVICCSKYEKEYLEQCNAYENVVVLGYPRMDKWFNITLNKNQIFIFPSWRDEIKENYVSQMINLCTVIHERRPDYQIIYAAHPSVEKEDYVFIRNKIKMISKEIVTFMCEDSDSFNQYFGTAKYLITDYSSVAYDFAYKRNAVSIYFKPFFDEENHYHLREDFYKHNCGVIVDDIEDLIAIISDEDTDKLIYNKSLEFFTYMDDNNTSRVANYINEN